MGNAMRRVAFASLAGLAACGTKDLVGPAKPLLGDGSATIEANGDAGESGMEDGATDAGASSSPSSSSSPTGTAPGDAAVGGGADASEGDGAAPSLGSKRGLAYGYDSDAD